VWEGGWGLNNTSNRSYRYRVTHKVWLTGSCSMTAQRAATWPTGCEGNSGIVMGLESTLHSPPANQQVEGLVPMYVEHIPPQIGWVHALGSMGGQACTPRWHKWHVTGGYRWASTKHPISCRFTEQQGVPRCWPCIPCPMPPPCPRTVCETIAAVVAPVHVFLSSRQPKVEELRESAAMLDTVFYKSLLLAQVQPQIKPPEGPT
jgi:hypothetical protein